MFKFKDGITGFVFNTEDHEIRSTLTSYLSEEEVKAFNKFSESEVLFTADDLDEVLELFNIEPETDLQEIAFDTVLEKV